MKLIENENNRYGYRYQHINKNGWIVCLHDVAFGTRVMIYNNKLDPYGLTLNICAGNQPSNILFAYMSIYKWLDSEPGNNEIFGIAQMLQNLEVSRPIPKSPNLVKALTKLKKSDTEFKPDKRELVFRPTTILPFLKDMT